MIEFIKYLPELISLVSAIKKKIDEDKVNRKVIDDLKSIKKAFNDKDASALDHIFNTELSDKTDKL